MQTRVDGLVYAYRTLGHTIARVNPLAEKRPENPLLSLRELGFSEKDLDLQVSSNFFRNNKRMALREMIAALEEIYADAVGTEFQHIQNPRIRNWVLNRLEARPLKHHASTQVEIALLRLLLEAEEFEVFLHTRYVGQKRFSLQGAESLMVILDTILHRCPAKGIEEICMGMAHRGRLNVLANFLKKSLKVIFTEFNTNYIPDLVAGDGDVKYHLGYRTIRKLASDAEIEIRLAANPSHLEAVDPVVEGTARARQRIRGDTEHRRKVLPLLIHGDAAFAGQGIVAETLNMSQLPGYTTGRNRARRGQQPDRFHHTAGRRAFLDVCHRRREDDRGADLPRERRRSNRGALRHRNRARFPPGIWTRRGHRHVLLPALRP